MRKSVVKLTRKQEAEIVEYDARSRRDRHKSSRKCLCYNYVIADKARDAKKRNVCVCHVAVKLDKQYRPCVKLVAATDLSETKPVIRYRDLGYHFLSGWHVYWDDSDWRNKAINAWIVSGVKGEFAAAEYKFGIGLTFPWDDTVNPEAILDTRYRYCAYVPGKGIGLLDWLMLYRDHPQVELLSKAGLYRLISPSGLRCLKSAKARDFVRSHMKELSDASLNVKEMVYCITHRTTPQDASGHFAFVNGLRQFLPRHCRWDADSKRRAYRLDYERVRRMIGKWGVSVSEYGRYICEAEDFGLDLLNDGTLYPPVRDGRKTFMERLERLEAENQKRHRKEERERKKADRERRKQMKAEELERARREQEYVKNVMASRLLEIDGFQKCADRVMKLSGADYICVLAKSQDELRREGRKMNNCVGGGTYGRGIVHGDTLILMFRDKRGKCWCDAEIDRSNWKIRQCYAHGNGAAPKEVQDMANAIAAELRRQHLSDKKAKRFPKLAERRRVA